ncbi:MAG: SDR family NAD(P)-dependent oxidoreductase [Verrucomicrobia bacterium]|nr:SDR family NAD(P)-dependent oxidoreductase [Verrucomicrobiota bacterium]
MNERLKNRWVAITGASSGFGAAAAAAFADVGAHVLLGARRVAKLQAVAEDARRQGAPSAAAHALDVADTGSVETFAAWVRSQTDRVDVLINNAGGAHGLDPIATGRDEDWDAMIQSNVLGLLRVTRAILPLMGSRPGACILNIGSIAGHTAYAGGAVYCAAKSAERAITRALRMELCGTGVRVGTIDPGIAETEFSMVRFKGDGARAAKVYEGAEPLTAADVAEAMVWAASRPPHVCIDEIVIKCTDQAEVYRIHRRPAPQG